MDYGHIRLAASHTIMALTGLKANALSKADIDAVSEYLKASVVRDHVSDLIYGQENPNRAKYRKQIDAMDIINRIEVDPSTGDTLIKLTDTEKSNPYCREGWSLVAFESGKIVKVWDMLRKVDPDEAVDTMVEEVKEEACEWVIKQQNEGRVLFVGELIDYLLSKPVPVPYPSGARRMCQIIESVVTRSMMEEED